MRIFSIKCKMSGNHGGEILNTTSDDFGTTVPQVSKQSFIKPKTVQPTISIKQAIQTTVEVAEEPKITKIPESEPASEAEEELMDNSSELFDNEHIENSENLEFTENDPSTAKDLFLNPFEKPEIILNNHWSDLVETVLKDVPSIYTIMKNTRPSFEKDELTIPVSNELIEDQVKQHSRDILNYLKSAMHLDHLSISVVIDHVDKVEAKPYDAKEIFDVMINSHQNLRDFVSILNLKYEY